MDAAAEFGRNPVSEHQIQPEYGDGKADADGTAEPVSRDQILRHARGQGSIHFPCSADHEQDWQPYPVDPYSAICDDHTYIHTYGIWTFLLQARDVVYCRVFLTHSLTGSNTGSTVYEVLINRKTPSCFLFFNVSERFSFMCFFTWYSYVPKECFFPLKVQT